MNKTRLEAFSDGVFAIIITIMVLEIKIPHGTLWADLCPLIPALFSYAMSFIYVGIYWGNHHHMVHAVKKVTPGIMWANMSLLFVLSLIPFATGWMGENHFAANTLILYATLLLLAGFTYTLLQLSIEHTHTFTSELQRAFSKMRTKGIISLVAYLLAIVLAMPAPFAAGLLIIGVAVMWLIPDRSVAEALKKEHHPSAE